MSTPTPPGPQTSVQPEDAPPALRVRGLRKSYAGREVVGGLDLDAARGHITAVLGPNGAGKTTSIECCEGLRTPDAGTVEVLGLTRHAEGRRRSAAVEQTLRHRVGVMLQDGGLPKSPSARAVLRHVASLHQNPWPVEELLERLDLRVVARTSVRRLSGGQAQRLALACAVVGRPDLVFLDEPSAGLDPHARRMVWALVEELRAQGTSMVLTTHLMDEAHRLSDEVYVLHRGTVVAHGSPAQLTGAPRMVLTLPAHAHPEDAVRARGVLLAAGFDVCLEDARTLSLDLPPGQPVDAQGIPVHLAVRVGAALQGAGLGETTAALRSRTLEDVFLDLTGDTLTVTLTSPTTGSEGTR